MKTKKQWEKKSSKIGLVLTITTLLMSIMIPLLEAGGGTIQMTAVLTATTACNFATSNAAINFGSLAVGTNTIGTSGSYNVITVTNTGSTVSNILLSGSNWNFAANTFTVTNTVWSGVASNTIFGNALTTVPSTAGTSNVETRLSGIATDSLQFTSNGVTANTLWFGANVPATVLSGTYSQTINVISQC